MIREASGRRRLLARSASVVAVVATVACSLGSSTPAPTATSGGSPPPVESPLGYAPDACPESQTPQTLRPDLGLALGSSPVWAVGFISARASGASLRRPGTVQRQGYPMKILWIMDHSLGLATHVRGRYKSSPIWLQVIDGKGPAEGTDLILDPKHPSDTASLTGGSADLLRFPGQVFVPSAGCYVLEASWPGGNWAASFGAGA